jgi:hypothetical protein
MNLLNKVHKIDKLWEDSISSTYAGHIDMEFINEFALWI